MADDIHEAINTYLENYDNINEYVKTVDKVHPIIPKMMLAREITARFHGEDEARKALDSWIYQFKNRRPDDIEEKTIWHYEDSIHLKNLLKDSGLTNSTSESLRMIKQRAVKIDNSVVEEDISILSDNIYKIYQVGKKRFLKIRISKSKGYA